MNDNCIVWFRKDLRFEDNPALIEAAKHKNIFPIFIFDNEINEYSQIGKASHWWLERSLEYFNAQLNKKLRVLEGNSKDLILKICKENNIKFIYWNRCYEQDRILIDSELKKLLKVNNIFAKSFNSSLLWEPWKIKNKSGNFYKVFTPFYKKVCLNAMQPKPVEKTPSNLNFRRLNGPYQDYEPQFLATKNKWYNKFEKYWEPSENEALKRFSSFLENGAKHYSEGRNFPSKNNVSRISAYLHWGQISPNKLWYDAKKYMAGVNKEKFLNELVWREFSYYLMYYYPNIRTHNIKTKFDKFKWINNKKMISCWERGKTGYPIVDAGMRELWQTGYMHNRVRMITASFLVKNLLTHWKYGEKWFWDCLIDADLASNSASWQWVAGTGCDAAPFFRIFNPITQAEKFDNNASYIKKYLPELKNLPNKFIFKPWQANLNILKDCKIKLGVDYPLPIIEYEFSRKRALASYKHLTME